MKKLLIHCLLSTSMLLLSSPSRSITLENNILKMIDGKAIGINGENIALVHKYQADILDIILGKKTKNGRLGYYTFEGKLYSAQELQHVEQTVTAKTTEQQSELQMALRTMREDFEKTSFMFRDLARSAKPVMEKLIEESCKKRNRGSDSLIAIWSKSNENEYVLFDRHIKSVTDFVIFMIDLYNFLGDLVHSCPLAQKQFQERLEKFSTIRKLLPALSLSAEEEQSFLRYIQSQLNKLDANHINAGTLKELYSSFQKA